MGRFKNKIFAKLFTRFPRLLDKAVEAVEPTLTIEGVPWAKLEKALSESTVAVVTTAGVHLKSQKPFDMEDPDGDPGYRELPVDTPIEDYTITHDYYDHSDADRDINIIFPIERLREFAKEGRVKGLGPMNYGFMGHIKGSHIKTLTEKTAPEVARKLANDGVNVVVLTPG